MQEIKTKGCVKHNHSFSYCKARNDSFILFQR